ncbi:c-type cytochrome biogenesis protein CcsB [Corynebacterium sp. MSK039]|uniref:c-type cytochrome biogenesis protein CcsB n=1 Tax=Corynebacterium sp. MSK039 TaxID=3050193 RepID=UPI0025514022|nr:c-type cytochrome biogenesis protein CcsB [Corynebacterium sp. MSK039]MDK8790978.1 c-type cytochrome biogenesis protein CcsB [Corynebacterium sp. MSK039]
MQINQDLAQFSDLAYKTTVVLYLLALAVSLFYYGLVRLANDARRERARVLKNEATPQESKRRQKVAVGAGASGADATDVAANEVGDDGVADVSGIATSSLDEADLPDSLSAETILQRVNRADTFGGITQALVWLAIAVHAAFLVLRGMSANRFPWGNLFEYVAVVTLFAMVAAAVVINRRSMRVMWPWVLTPVTLLLFYGGTKLYAETAPVVPALQSNWFVIHVSTVSIGGGIGLLSGMASLMYLLRRWHPKGQEKGFFGAIASPLPDASKLDALAYRSAIWTLPIFGLGIIFGAIWADAAWGRFWGWDPKETVSFITWILYAAYLHARATPGWRGTKAAWINVIAFATMVFNLFFINMVVSGLHSYAGLN